MKLKPKRFIYYQYLLISMGNKYDRINITLPELLLEEFKEFCKKNGINLSSRIAILIKKDLLAILSDKPTKDDLLNFKDYSDLLTNVVVNSETPSTIGIFGDWGSGKTSLMLMIDEHLQKKNIKTIWFNAWKYDKEEALWRALIFSILKGLSAGQKEIDDATLKLYAAVSTESLGKVQIDWLEIGKTALKGIVFFMAPLLLIPGIANAFANAGFLDQISNAFTKRKVQQSQERIS